MARLATGTSASTTGDFNEYGTLIKLVRGDQLGEVTFTLKDSNKGLEPDAQDDGIIDPILGIPTTTTVAEYDSTDPDTWAPIDLTGATIVLKMREEGSSTVKTTIPIYAQEPLTEGKVFFAWTPEALDTAGMFTGEIEITYTSGKVMTVYKELRFQIREDY